LEAGGYPSSLRLSSITPPSKNEVKPNHILVRIHAAALNPVDIQIMNLPIWSIPLPMFTSEKTICSDFSGTVIQGGEGSGFSEGDEVFGVQMMPFKPCAGTLSEVAHIDLGSACVIKKPADWSFREAAVFGCVFLTAKTSIEKVKSYVDSSTSKRVVVLGGSSACGIYTILLAKKRGWKILATCSGRNAEFVRETLGADEVVDYTKQNVREEVKKFKPEAVIDDVGGTECIGLSKRYITIVGDKTGRTTMGGPLTYYLSFVPRQWIRWTLGRLGLTESYDVITLETKKEYLEECKELRKDQIFIDSTFSMDNAKDAYERLNTGRARGKVIVEIPN
jgi:NADPH:quinone reductase-like Zn-dependent oxidoreductase